MTHADYGRWLEDLQVALAEWYRQNFGDLPDTYLATKLLEEAGEAGHAVVRLYLKEHGKKQVNPNSEEMLRDAIGDTVIVLSQLAANHGWVLADIIADVAAGVMTRDYRRRA